MTIRFLHPFVQDYKKLDPPVRLKVDKLLDLLVRDMKHPSLRVHKMVNRTEVYEARVDVHFRVTFEKNGDVLIMRRVGTHEIYRKP